MLALKTLKTLVRAIAHDFYGQRNVDGEINIIDFLGKYCFRFKNLCLKAL